MKQFRLFTHRLKHSLVCASLLLPAFPYPALAAPKAAEKEVALTVVKGDTLLKICRKHLKVKEKCFDLARKSGFKNLDLIFPGQKLAIPIRYLKLTPMHGVVTFLKGDVGLRREQGEDDWETLKLSDRVQEGCSVRTGAASALEITFEDGSTVFQEDETDVELQTVRKGPFYYIRELYLLGGRTMTKVKRATGREQRFIINTPSALAAVRGTEFRMSSDEDWTTFLEVMSGAVDITAMGRDVAVKGKEGTRVKMDRPPMVPRRLLPPPRIIVPPAFVKLPLEFRFTKIEGAEAYRILLTRDREGRDIVREEFIEPDAPLLISEIEDGSYHIRGISIDRFGITGTTPEPVALNIRINPLPPYLRLPVEGSEFISPTVELNWLKVGDAAGYHLQIAQDREFTKIVSDVADLKDVRYKTEPLELGEYFFRVGSVAKDGHEGIWSDIQSFSVVAPPLPRTPPAEGSSSPQALPDEGAPSPQPPPAKASPPPPPVVEAPTVDGEEIRIRWQDLGPGYTYRCQIAKDETFEEVLVERVVTEPEITVEKPEKAGTYFVRTSAADAKGYQGEFSPPQSFKISEGFPYGILGILVPVGLLLLLVL